MGSKFRKYDLVELAENLGAGRQYHTGAGEKGIVQYSYAEQYGGNTNEEYCVFFRDRGEVSWYAGRTMKLLAHDQKELQDQWRRERADRKAQQSDLDWIFANHREARDSGYSIEALAATVGLTDLWPSGEGFEWAENAARVWELAQMYVVSGDKEGWLKRAEEIKEHLATRG